MLKLSGFLLVATGWLAGSGCDRGAAPAPVTPAQAPATVAATQSAAEKEWLAQGEAGDAEAQFRLGLLYLSSVEGPVDADSAAARFRAAADAFLATNTTGVVNFPRATPDTAKALQWLSRAAAPA